MTSILLALLLSFFSGTQQEQTMPSTTQPVHVTNTFRFHLAAPLPRVAPLFGPEGERCWGGSHWNPQFLHPQPAHDVEGAVFTVQKGPHKSVWVATIFDPAAGRMQYVAMIPDVVVSVIDVRLTESTASQTSVEVTYSRTALEPAANDDVRAMGESDRQSGPDWQKAIASCLAAPAPKHP